MLFNSYEFIFIFLPLSFFVYFYLNKKKYTEASNYFLVFSSLFFYSWWSIIYLPLIISSMVFNYLVGRILSNYTAPMRCMSKKYILAFGITSNLLLLGYFKYSDFFIETFNWSFGSHVDLLNLALPLAISFFTFQQISYLVDSYRQETHEYSFLNYALFVTFFPQLIAGPIVHHREMMPQFGQMKNKVISYQNVSLGLFIFSIGLFKKVAIADTFAMWATSGFSSPSTLNIFEAWVTSLSYTFQLYFDFSGYTDMAIGIALLFNIKLPINFNSPYKSKNIQDFWRRWHITLSRFLRDYVYIPLGGNRKGNLRTYSNFMATFILGGLWHGAGWTFIVWGGLHGLALVVYSLWGRVGIKLPGWLSWFITFNFINLTWVFFRSEEWGDAIKIIGAMFNIVSIHQELLNFVSLNANKEAFVWLLAAFCIVLLCKNSIELLQLFKASIKSALFMILLFVTSLLLLNNKSEFLYFNF